MLRSLGSCSPAGLPRTQRCLPWAPFALAGTAVQAESRAWRGLAGTGAVLQGAQPHGTGNPVLALVPCPR